MFQLEELGIDDTRISQIFEMARQVAANGTDQSKITQSLSRTLGIIRHNAIGDPNMVFDAMAQKITEMDNAKAEADLNTLFARLKQLGVPDDTTHRFKNIMAQLVNRGVTLSQQSQALNGVLKTAIRNGIGDANMISDAMEQTLNQALTD